MKKKHRARVQALPRRWGWSALRLTATATNNGTAAIVLHAFGGDITIQLTHPAALALADALVDAVEAADAPGTIATHIHE